MNKMQVGVDIDGVLAMYVKGFLTYYNKKYGTTFKAGEVSGKIADLLDFSKDEYLNEAFCFMQEGLVLLETVKLARAYVFQLAKKYDLHVITARSESLSAPTLAWLDRHFRGCFESINFCNTYEQGRDSKKKSDFISELGIEIMIEDEVGHIYDITENGIPVVIIRAPWNREVRVPFMSHYADSWVEVVGAIDGFANLRKIISCRVFSS